MVFKFRALVGDKTVLCILAVTLLTACGGGGSSSIELIREEASSDTNGEEIFTGVRFSTIPEIWTRLTGASTRIEIRDSQGLTQTTSVPVETGAEDWRIALSSLVAGNYTLIVSFIDSQGEPIARVEREINADDLARDIPIIFDQDNALKELPPPYMVDEDRDGYLEIEHPLHLLDINEDLEGSYELNRNLDLSGREWRPIGTGPFAPFTGTLIGNDYTISGLNVSGYEYGGIFSYISGARIIDLRIGLNYIGGGKYLGALAGAAVKNSELSDVEVVFDREMTINSESELFFGGIVGYANDVEISASKVYFNNPLYINASATTSLAFGGVIGVGYSIDTLQRVHIYHNENIILNGGSDINYAGLVAGTLRNADIEDIFLGTSASFTSTGFVEETPDIVTQGSWNFGGLFGELRDSDLNMVLVNGALNLAAKSRGEINLGGILGYSHNIRINSAANGQLTEDYALWVTKGPNLNGISLEDNTQVGVIGGSMVESSVFAALFPIVKELSAESTQGETRAGGVFGYLADSEVDFVISGGLFSGSISYINASAQEGNSFAGALAGDSYNNLIQNIFFVDGVIHINSISRDTAAYAGGLLGRGLGDTIIRNSAMGMLLDVRAIAMREVFSGGLAAVMRGGSIDKTSITLGRFEAVASAVETNVSIGGILGFCDACSLSNSHSHLSGLKAVTVNSSDLDINMAAIGELNIGAMVGSANNANINGSYATVADFIVEGESDYVSADGLVGRVTDGSGEATEVRTSYYALGFSLDGNHPLSTSSGMMNVDVNDVYNAERKYSQFLCATRPGDTCSSLTGESIFENWSTDIWSFNSNKAPELRWISQLLNI